MQEAEVFDTNRKEEPPWKIIKSVAFHKAVPHSHSQCLHTSLTSHRLGTWPWLVALNVIFHSSGQRSCLRLLNRIDVFMESLTFQEALPSSSFSLYILCPSTSFSRLACLDSRVHKIVCTRRSFAHACPRRSFQAAILPRGTTWTTGHGFLHVNIAQSLKNTTFTRLARPAPYSGQILLPSWGRWSTMPLSSRTWSGTIGTTSKHRPRQSRISARTCLATQRLQDGAQTSLESRTNRLGVSIQYRKMYGHRFIAFTNTTKKKKKKLDMLRCIYLDSVLEWIPPSGHHLWFIEWLIYKGFVVLFFWGKG